MSKVAIVTLGCSKNSVSTRDMERKLRESGVRVVDDPVAADIVLVNSCGFIESAKRESIDTTLEVLDIRGDRHGPLVYLTGCLAQRSKKHLAEAIPELDGVLDFQDIGPFIESLGAPGTGGDRQASAAAELSLPPSAYLQIADGCSSACSFCAIPFIKGPYKSKSMESVLDEATMLVESGVRELVLVAQDSGLYGVDNYGKCTLLPLLRELQEIDDLVWLRLMYLNPAAVTPGLIDGLASMGKLCAYIDLPLQHASRSVLRRMRRSGDGVGYLDLIGELRDALEGLWLRSEFIVGFPGETESDFSELVDFVEEAAPDYAGIFEYSREEGTAAHSESGQVPTRVRGVRAAGLRAVADAAALERKAGLVGERVEVLLEQKLGAGDWLGRYAGQAPEIDGDVRLSAAGGDAPAVGRLVTARILDTCGYDLTGEMV